MSRVATADELCYHMRGLTTLAIQPTFLTNVPGRNERALVHGNSEVFYFAKQWPSTFHSAQKYAALKYYVPILAYGDEVDVMWYTTPLVAPGAARPLDRHWPHSKMRLSDNAVLIIATRFPDSVPCKVLLSPQGVLSILI
jgi:hypothetical protein